MAVLGDYLKQRNLVLGLGEDRAGFCAWRSTRSVRSAAPFTATGPLRFPCRPADDFLPIKIDAAPVRILVRFGKPEHSSNPSWSILIVGDITTFLVALCSDRCVQVARLQGSLQTVKPKRNRSLAGV